jgi:hypothetical protein
MLAGGWALGAGACAVVDTLLAAMLVEGMAANGWALDAGAWAGSGTLLLASMVDANGWALGTGAWASAGVLLLADGWAGASATGVAPGHGAWLADLIGAEVDNPMSGPPTAG